MSDYYTRTDCRLCGKKDLQKVLELAPTPPGNHFVTREQLSQKQATYPLQLDFCKNCFHLQLGHVVDPEILYRQNYSYFSSTSPVFVNHLKEYASEMSSKYSIPAGSLVLDVGSNDGTALSFFKKLGYKTLGIDPATQVSQIANESGIETLCEFFSVAVAKKYREKYGPAALVNSHNVCAHIDDLRSVFDGVHYWLADDGVFTVEVGYFMDVFENTLFDTIYHEHVDYHTFSPLVKFFDSTGFEVIAAARNKSQGGTLRVTAQKKGGARKVESSVAELLKLEKDKGFDQPATFLKYGDKIQLIKKELGAMVAELKKTGKKIAGYGAPTKATTLLTYFELGDSIDFIVDDNPYKQNLFSPGLHIPVHPTTYLTTHKPDYLVVLSWNFADEIMKRNRSFASDGGKFIVPLPKPRIVSDKDLQ